MIQIDRSNVECPKTLKGSPKKGTRYNKKSVVKALWKMQHQKCCYCESLIPDEGHLKAVEHFHPKSVFKKKQNDWKNLLLCCAQCNGEKSNKFPTELTDNNKEVKVVYLKKPSQKGKKLIIDPSNPDINPEDHIDFIVDPSDMSYGLAKAKNNSRLGRTTIKVIGLDSCYYTRARYNFFRLLRAEYDALLLSKEQENESLIDVHKNKFVSYMSAKNEFAAFARAFIRRMRLDRNFAIQIPVGAQT